MTALRISILAFLLFGLGMLAGQHVEHLKGQAQLADLRESVAETQRLAAQSSAHRLQAAQERGDALTLQVADRDGQINSLLKEKRHALAQTTFGRACLGTAALRVLDGAAGLRVADLPEASGGTDAADGRVATDTDLGQWALDAGAQYERCRQRLGALIDWHISPQPSTPQR